MPKEFIMTAAAAGLGIVMVAVAGEIVAKKFLVLTERLSLDGLL